MSHVCGPDAYGPSPEHIEAAGLADVDFICCWGAAMNEGRGEYCQCWQPIFDRDLAPIDAATPDPHLRDRPCDGCAYTPGTEAHEWFGEDQLARLAATPGQRFLCHANLALIVAWAHPDGFRVDVPAADQVTGGERRVNSISYGADGRRVQACAGHARAAARHAAEVAP